MSLLDALGKVGRLSTPSMPELRYLEAAAQKVRDRWPDVRVSANEQDREALAQKLRERVERWDWEERKTRISFVISAATAVFDPERRDRDDLAGTREFLYDEIDASTSETLLSGLLQAHVESYEPKAPHTRSLAKGLKAATPRMSGGSRHLLGAIPELLDPTAGPKRLAERMAAMSDPFTELVRLGLRSPHATGFMDHAHLALTRLLRDELSDRDRIDWYLRWLRPPGKTEGRTIGAEAAIEALIHPWLKRSPDDKLTSYLVETLIELYGDPRIKSGGVWGGIGETYMAIVYRWLTREDMRFFTGVVDATQNSAMWPPRRDFWLKLYDEGKIDAAWAALSKEGFQYAIRHLMRQDAKNAYTRVGYQAGRPNTNTSLLIMKIGNKIVVDGCHNYRTHVFDIDDPMAPKLFEEGYECDEIMRASPAAKPHGSSRNSMEPWKRWVRDMINADVPRSRRKNPYSFVPRPRPPKPINAPAPRPVPPRYVGQRSPSPGVGASAAGKGLFSPRAGSRPSSGSERNSPLATGDATTPRVTAGERDQNVVPKPRRLGPGDPPRINQAQPPTLTDKMIAYGPKAAEAVLAYLEAPNSGRNRPVLSPKSSEGLAWVRTFKGELPSPLRNSLEYLLDSLKRSGVDLDALFASGVAAAKGDGPAAVPRSVSRPALTAKPPGLPPLPELADERLDLLRAHADALEELGMQKRTFPERKSFAIAVQKLKERSPDLRPAEVADLQALYGELRKRDKGGRG